MNKKYFLSLLTILTIVGMGSGTVGFAQTVTPLYCNPGSSTVGTNQAILLSATGGNGAYIWSGQNLNVTNPTGSQFSVSYPSAGTYSVMISSGGQTATCNVNVVGGGATGNLACAPAVQNVMLGQTASVSATGGNGAYVWSSPDISIANPNGSGFSANYGSTGQKTLTVTSAGSAATCTVNVLSNNVIPVPVTPGFPNTGGGYGQ